MRSTDSGRFARPGRRPIARACRTVSRRLREVRSGPGRNGSDDPYGSDWSTDV